MPSAKVLARVQMLTIALNALTLKTESSVSLNVHSRSIPRTEIVSIVMSHAMVAKVQETQFPMMDVLIVKTLSLTEPFKSVSRKIQLAQVRLQEGWCHLMFNNCFHCFPRWILQRVRWTLRQGFSGKIYLSPVSPTLHKVYRFRISRERLLRVRQISKRWTVRRWVWRESVCRWSHPNMPVVWRWMPEMSRSGNQRLLRLQKLKNILRRSSGETLP